MRQAFSDSLVAIAKKDPRVLLLTGDHGYALFDEFRKHCPNQYINAGIAEQNMVGMAAGLARAGFIPFVYGLAAFIPIRVLEQIKLDIAHDNLHVILLGDGAGFVYSSLGTSHQSTEDIAATRAIPNLQILSPADRFEQTLCMQWAYECKKPVYMRMGKSDRGDIYMATSAPRRLEGLSCIREKNHPDAPTLIATGSLVKTAIEIANEILPQCSVWSVPIIKPFDNRVLLESILEKTRTVIVMEEHSINGGLGSLIAEISAEKKPINIIRIGVEDKFTERCGSYNYLLKEHGLDKASIIEKIKKHIKQ